MKRLLLIIGALSIYVLVAAQQVNKNYSFSEQLFDEDWRFHLGDIENGQETKLDDASWRIVQIPHDWSIEDLPGTNSPFNPDVINGVSVGFTTGGTGWYRKSFVVPVDQKDKKIHIQFDAVYMNADVWINGEHLGNHPYGYTSFWFDLTSKIKFGAKNTIAVRVRNEGANSRWYAGSGITRHVWIKEMQPVYVSQWGTHINTPSITKLKATVNVATTLMNEMEHGADIKVITKVINNKGEKVVESQSVQHLNSGAVYTLKQVMDIKNPLLWSTTSPSLYTSITKLYYNDKLVNQATTKFGIRSISFDAKRGFLLNGVSVKLKGACYHVDNGPLGARSFDRAEERRVELLKESGFNAIRCSHNPPPQAFLDACDRLGMMVIDEFFDMWSEGKNDQDYHLYFKDWWKRDVESTLLRDRNHPSIIMWSIGNEIPGIDKLERVEEGRQIAKIVRELDSTRPVTAAVNSVTKEKDAIFSVLDIAGYNYAKDNYVSDHERVPERIIFCTESYALQAFDYWMGVLDHSWVIGDFVWTGFDYIGEASIGWLGYPQEKTFYPWNLAYCGDIDICGWKRPQSYYRDVLWKKDQLSIFVKPPQPSFPVNPKKEPWSIWNWDDVVSDWNWKGEEGKPMEVNVYSSCQAVELFLNDKSMGRQTTDRTTKFRASWNVPYEKGVLRAIGYNNGRLINTASLQTAGEAVKIKLTADRLQLKAAAEDLSYITVELADKNGIRNTRSGNTIRFTVDGPGEIVAVGNADPTSIESYQQQQRRAWQGRCLVIIKALRRPGNIVLHASADGFVPASVNIVSRY